MGISDEFGIRTRLECHFSQANTENILSIFSSQCLSVQRTGGSFWLLIFDSRLSHSLFFIHIFRHFDYTNRPKSRGKVRHRNVLRNGKNLGSSFWFLSFFLFDSPFIIIIASSSFFASLKVFRFVIQWNFNNQRRRQTFCVNVVQHTNNKLGSIILSSTTDFLCLSTDSDHRAERENEKLLNVRSREERIHSLHQTNSMVASMMMMMMVPRDRDDYGQCGDQWR